jgi:hypothetical protein
MQHQPDSAAPTVREHAPRAHVPIDCRTPHGQKLPTISAAVPAAEYHAIRETADRLGVSVSTLLRTAAREFLRGL